MGSGFDIQTILDSLLTSIFMGSGLTIWHSIEQATCCFTYQKEGLNQLLHPPEAGGMMLFLSDAIALHQETTSQIVTGAIPGYGSSWFRRGGSRAGRLAEHLLLLDRRQCVMFCHDLTRYVLFILGLRAAQFAELGRWHRELFLAMLAAQGISPTWPDSHSSWARFRQIAGLIGWCWDRYEWLPMTFNSGICPAYPMSWTLTLSQFPISSINDLHGWKGFDLAGRGDAEVGRGSGAASIGGCCQPLPSSGSSRGLSRHCFLT